jgi:hypothetical protein
MVAAQPGCRETMLLQRTTSLNIVSQSIAGVLLPSDILQGQPRLVVSECQRRQIFAAIHKMAHPGVRATRCLVSRLFTWKGKSVDVAAWTKETKD